MDARIVHLLLLLFSTSEVSFSDVSAEEDVQPYFTKWNNSYYAFYHRQLSWQAAVDDCRADNGWMPVISKADSEALIDDFYEASSNCPAEDCYAWLGSDCSGYICTPMGGVLENSLWDESYPKAESINDSGVAMVWRRKENAVRHDFKDSSFVHEYICQYSTACASARVTCLTGGACMPNTSTTTAQCWCDMGYTRTSSDCVDIDECASNPCGTGVMNGSCVNGVNAYTCDQAVVDIDSPQAQSSDDSDSTVFIGAGVGLALFILLTIIVVLVRRKRQAQNDDDARGKAPAADATVSAMSTGSAMSTTSAAAPEGSVASINT